MVEKSNINNPIQGQKYYYIDSSNYYGIREWDWTNSDVDKLRYKYGNFYNTKEEAEFELEKSKVITELKHLSNLSSENKIRYDCCYRLFYDLDNLCVNYVACDTYAIEICQFSFYSPTDAENAIKKLEKKN